jgi:hypothetical protein
MNVTGPHPIRADRSQGFERWIKSQKRMKEEEASLRNSPAFSGGLGLTNLIHVKRPNAFRHSDENAGPMLEKAVARVAG